MNTARVIVTQECKRDCEYCCNKQDDSFIINNATILTNIDQLAYFDNICISGGEPMLYPHETLTIIKEIKDRWDKKIFLYTAWYTDDLYEIMSYIDGVHYTIHFGIGSNENRNEGQDKIYFGIFQDLVEKYYRSKNFRLCINPNYPLPLEIKPWLWGRVEIKPFLAKCPLPENEELFIIK